MTYAIVPILRRGTPRLYTGDILGSLTDADEGVRVHTTYSASASTRPTLQSMLQVR
jgi:hypothetical protein